MIQDQAAPSAADAPNGAPPTVTDAPNGAPLTATVIRLVPKGARPARDQGPIDAEARHRIGRNLKLLYADVLTQPLPERFETLLADLSASSGIVTPRETS
ncbi:NepR family anti-sigma factor [Methylobacterium sp. Leaf108]|uniref:NepR family anti-sigma factor n=1 Tax=Methylobacterium sp. Leaf108 TaxID=1736256 RepID=UPI000B049CC3|nr:NepR family anti-sigma factor [Methylobacterium sp. Leaf108]